MNRRLIAIAAVLAVALYLLWPTKSDLLHDVPSDVQLCKENLFAIHSGLLKYEQRFGHAPEASGPAFLAALIESGVWEDTLESRARLTCPGPGADPVHEDVDYSAPASLGGKSTAYAARDCARFPLAKFPAGGADREPIVACDNAGGLNHDGVMNVLFSDRTIETLSLAHEIERGRLPAGAKNIEVGSAATIEELKKLQGD